MVESYSELYSHNEHAWRSNYVINYDTSTLKNLLEEGDAKVTSSLRFLDGIALNFSEICQDLQQLRMVDFLLQRADADLLQYGPLKKGGEVGGWVQQYLTAVRVSMFIAHSERYFFAFCERGELAAKVTNEPVEVQDFRKKVTEQ